MSEARDLRVAMAQMRVEWGGAEANLARAAEMVRRGAEEGCEVVLLPECLDIGWTHPDAERLAEPVPGSRTDLLAAAAKGCGVWLVGGLTEADGDLTYNTAVVISPDGEVVLKHRKINLLDIARPFYAVGDRMGVVSAPAGRIGVNICADNAPGSLALGHCLGRMGARVLLSPCAWAVDADDYGPYGEMWKNSYRELGRLYEMPVVGVSNVGWIEGGPWEGRKCIGNSLAVDSEGGILTEGPFGVDAEALLTVRLRITPPPAVGTDVADMLRQKGRDPV